MCTRFFKYLLKPYTVVLVMLFTPVLGIIDRNFVFFLSLGVVFLILKHHKYDWSVFGFGKRITKKTVYHALLITILLTLIFYTIEPILEHYLGRFDLSAFEDIKGNLAGYLILLIIMWFFAAFGEELLFRGYYMKGLAKLFGNSRRAWLISAFLTSVYFGVSHSYQGLIGVIAVFLWSFCMSLLFIKNKQNLGLLVLIHGFYDTIGITLLYLDEELFITEWIRALLT